jgi:hypothetical protein
MIRSMLTLSLLFVLASWANAEPPKHPNQTAAEKKAKEALIKQNKEALIKQKEFQIRELESKKPEVREREKIEHHILDERFHNILKYIDPKEIHNQLIEGERIARHVREVISIGDYDYGGHRIAAIKHLEHAEHQLHEAVLHPGVLAERAKAMANVLDAHTHVKKALEYSIVKYGLGVDTALKAPTEPESRAAVNRQLAVELPKIEFTYYLLVAVNHEIKDYEIEKRELLNRLNAEKHNVTERINGVIKAIDHEIGLLHKDIQVLRK